MSNKERFISLCESINRPGIDGLMKWLEENDFYTAPASTRFHGAYAGGLLDHSLNVYDELERLLKAYPEINVSDESKIICSLFHDLCKVNLYATEKRNRKNSDGQWESYDAYTTKEKFCYGGHGMPDVILYSTGCPRCDVLKDKLETKGVVYTENNSVEEMTALGIDEVPILSIDGKLHNFKEAVEWVNNL